MKTFPIALVLSFCLAALLAPTAQAGLTGKRTYQGSASVVCAAKGKQLKVCSGLAIGRMNAKLVANWGLPLGSVGWPDTKGTVKGQFKLTKKVQGKVEIVLDNTCSGPSANSSVIYSKRASLKKGANVINVNVNKKKLNSASACNETLLVITNVYSTKGDLLTTSRAILRET